METRLVDESIDFFKLKQNALLNTITYVPIIPSLAYLLNNRKKVTVKTTVLSNRKKVKKKHNVRARFACQSISRLTHRGACRKQD